MTDRARMGDQMLTLANAWVEVAGITTDGACCCLVNGAMIFINEYATEPMVKPVDGVSYWRQLS